MTLNRKFRRWPQLRLTTFLMFVLLAAIALGWWSDRQRMASEIQNRENLIAVLRMFRDDVAKQVNAGLDIPGVIGAALEIPASAPEKLEFIDVEALLDWVRHSEVFPDPNKLAISMKEEGHEAAAVPSLLTMLREGNPDVRSRAAFALGQTRFLETSHVLTLATAVRDGDMKVRVQTAWSLWKMRTKAREAAPLLAERLDALHPEYLKLTSFDEVAPAKHVEYIAQLEEFEEAGLLVDVVHEIDPDFDLVPSLIRLVRQRSPWTRLWAAEQIAELGPRAARATQPMAAMLGDEESECRMAAADALAKIAQPEEALSHLLRAFAGEKDENVRKKIATVANDLDRQVTSQKP